MKLSEEGTLQKRRDPTAWDDRLMYEQVLAFRKPEGQGNGVDAVITSPPYEGSDIKHGVQEGTFARQTVRREAGHFQGYTRKEPP